jgi:internalin A
MPSHPEGLAIARARIAEEKEKRTGFLDLGRLGLTELPEAMFELENLWGLNLGSAWWDQQGEWHEVDSDLAPNQPRDFLPALHHFPRLTHLSIAGTDVSDLGPLADLQSLQSLVCDSTQVSDLAPLANLQALQSLDCWRTQVSDLAPLANLQALQSLDCSWTQVSDLAPLANLQALQSLNCSWTQVSDLAPLANLQALQSLDCSYTQVSDLPEALIWLISLKELCLFSTRITDIPAEVLSPNWYTSCLENLRAHLRDLKAGGERLPDVKVLVLGNGRIGKTQICRRLRGEAFEANADSTHGILVTSAVLPMPNPGAKPGRPRRKKSRINRSARADEESLLHLWDFGGQDLYHGTHALFMQTRSLFILVWTSQSEDTREYEYGGMTFRNHPLAHWLEYVRHLSGTNSPLLIVQNMCDRAEDELLHPPVQDQALQDFPFRKLLHYSALKDRGRGSLDDALRQAIQWLRENMGQSRIGCGRLAVKRKLEALRDKDAALPVERRKYRTLTQEFFHRLCTEAGDISSPAMLLDYLHHAGIVFYQKGLFDDCIVLDQGWALEAVYAVFHRQKCYRQLRQLRGRFTRALLEALVWQAYRVEEQKLFLSLMTSCGVCFVHRQENQKGEVETEYIAPDLLPDREAVVADIEAMWGEPAPGGEMVVEVPFLHPGIMRGIISGVGKAAGISALYWKYGVCLYEKTTRSRALIEQTISDHPNTWSGQIAVSTRGGQGAELLQQLHKWIKGVLERSGCRDWTITEISESLRPIHESKDGRSRSVEGGPVEIAPDRKLEFTPMPSDKKTYCVSYAWNDESTAVVDGLCEAARQQDIEILRDKTGLGLGESISRFMQKLGAGDRVFVILSEKYLKSPYCMYELLEVWRNCKMDDEVFRQRIRVFRLPDARMSSPLDRAHCAKYWKEQFTELDAVVRKHGADLLGQADFKRYKLMQDFAHRVGDMLALIADTLQPRDFEELKKHGFAD